MYFGRGTYQRKFRAKGQRYYISLKVFLFLIEERRIRRAVEFNNQSIHYYKFLDLE